jgi:uncharacterized protein (DUF58 family)
VALNIAGLKKRSAFADWLRFARGRSAPVAGPVSLVHRRVYILPTGRGLAFAFALLCMLVGSINYSLSLGYMLTFLLTGMCVVAMLHTYRNLVHLRVGAGRADPAFAGEEVRFELQLGSSGHYPRIALELKCEGAQAQADIPVRDETAVELRIHARRRGWQALPRIRVSTRYPLGLLEAWAYVHLDVRALIYPKPDRSTLEDIRHASRRGATNAASGSGTDDFFGLRPYHLGDSLRHVAWKAAAHNDLLLTKTFTANADTELVFDYARLPAALDMEARVSRLTRWVLLAEEAGLSYGLVLPDTQFAPGSGAAHRYECLQALALLGLPQQ